MYRITDIKLNLNEKKSDIPNKIKEKVRKKNLEILEWKIVKESIDARKKPDIKLVYTIDFACEEMLDLPIASDEIKCDYSQNKVNEISDFKHTSARPIIVGFGPCGMFCGLALSLMGLKPIILERGKKVEERAIDVRRLFKEGIINPESNVQFGEGGAGTFSDGKLTTGIKDSRIKIVLNEFCLAGASEEIMYKSKPHIGTDVLIKVVKNIREKIIKNGGTIIFGAKVINLEIWEEPNQDLDKSNGISDNDETQNFQNTKTKKITGLSYIKEGEIVFLETNNVVLATGQSAVDVYELLNRLDVKLEQKPFSMGFRVVHPQKLINISQYGNEEIAEKLGAAEYKLSCKTSNGRGAYTFCMCPGGEVVIASSNLGEVLTNGMSNHNRDSEFANSAILVDVKTSDFSSNDPMAGLEFRNFYERKAYEINGCKHRPIKTTWKEFKEIDNIMKKCLPEFVSNSIVEAMRDFGKKIKGFDKDETVFLGPETRSSSPVRIPRDERLESNVKGLFPGGEGAAAAGGIMSASVDGLKIAESIYQRYSQIDSE